MTAKSAFTPDEWKRVAEGPPAAGLIVVTAARGGTFRETIAMAKAYTLGLAATISSRSSLSPCWPRASV